MKLSTAAILLCATTFSWSNNASAAKSVTSFRGEHLVKKSLLAKSRRLDEEDEEEEEEDENDFLQYYKVKFMYCLNNQSWKNEDGEKEYNSVHYRLCPANSNDDGKCNKGYGDYIIGLNTFLDEWVEFNEEDDRRKLEQEDFDLKEYTECREYDIEEEEDSEDEDDRRKKRRRKLDEEEEAEEGYFIGPACTADGADIRLALYSEEYCRYESEETFASISNGDDLPYAEGGLAPYGFISCYGKNDDGEAEIEEMCEGVYEDAYKCETNMEQVSAVNGRNEKKCEYIQEIIKKDEKSSGGKAGKVFLWLLVIAIVIGGVYFYMQHKEKNNQADKKQGLVNNSGVSA